MIKVIKFKQAIRSSSSLPLIVTGEDGITYVMKLKGGSDGLETNISEWLSYRLGRELGIPVVGHALLEVAGEITSQAGDPEIKELLDKSLGINFGTMFVEHAANYN